MRLLLLFFIGIPLLEMVVLIQVGSVIGALPTVALVVLTATIGLWLLRMEGLATMAKVQSKLSNGEMPGTELLEGAMLLVGGALLLTPGFITDTIGFICLIPIFRHPLAKWMMRNGLMKSGFMQGGQGFSSQFSNSHYSASDTTRNTVIEGEFEEQSTSSIDTQKPSDTHPRNDRPTQ